MYEREIIPPRRAVPQRKSGVFIQRSLAVALFVQRPTIVRPWALTILPEAMIGLVSHARGATPIRTPPPMVNTTGSFTIDDSVCEPAAVAA